MENKKANTNLLIGILFLLTCAAATFDTHLFVYPSLSRSLLMEAGLLVCGLTVFCTQILKSPTDSADCTDNSNKIRSIGAMRGHKFLHLYVFAWVAYILVHGWLSPVTEWYRTTYLCVTLLSIITLSNAVGAGLLARRFIVGGLMVIAAAHVMAVFAQWLGFMQPEDALYPITGFNDNPNVTAMYLVGVTPLLTSPKGGDGHQDMVFSLKVRVWLGLFIFFALLLLRCRTAYIGLAVEICVFLFMKFSPTDTSDKHRLSLSGNKFVKICAICGTIIIAAIFVGKLYNMKRDSADGRLLIWRLSAQMIVEQPLGHGYGLFEKHYNQRQAEYFMENGGTDTERRTATFTCMAYNDYLEHGVDGGIIGMAFLIGFYTLTIRRAVKQRDKISAATLAAFAVMSLVNFVTTGIQTWLLVICVVSMIQKPLPPPSPIGREPHSDNFCAMASSTLKRKKRLGFICVAVPSITGGEALALFFVISMTMSQVGLKKLSDRLKAGERIPDSEFAVLEGSIYSSEAYWRTRAMNAMQNGDCTAAMMHTEKALQLSSNPSALVMLSQCRLQQKDTIGAVRNLETACYIRPSLLYPKLYLMRLYAKFGDMGKALSMAGDILSTQAKVDNEEARLIHREAATFIQRHRQ